jgi:ribosomal protein L11 methyltransferase
MTNWLEVSLTVNGELAEAVADVLGRFAPNGVMTEQSVEFLNDEDEGTPSGDVTVRAYLPVNEETPQTQHRLEEALYYLGTIQPLPAPAFKVIADQNWMEAWKSNYKPILIGKRLLILPAWLESPHPERIAIKIDPGMAFGTGTHPTTQLCLEITESIFDQHPAPYTPDVIDVGCGSGILSVAALKLGARFALGVDIDEAAAQNSRENAENNGIAPQSLVFGVGSVQEVKQGDFPLQQAPLVLANILAPVLIRLFDAGLADLIAPGGAIVLSGILLHQAAGVVAAGEAQGLKLVDERHILDWVALWMEKPQAA